MGECDRHEAKPSEIIVGPWRVQEYWLSGEYWSTGALHPHPLRASADTNLPFQQRFERKLLQKDNSGRTVSRSLQRPGMKCGIAITVTRSGWLLQDDNT